MHAEFWDGAGLWSSVSHVMAMGRALTGLHFISLCHCPRTSSVVLVTKPDMYGAVKGDSME